VFDFMSCCCCWLLAALRTIPIPNYVEGGRGRVDRGRVPKHQ
jgi:hypothetical protein